ncbi:MAG: hypothetical protein HY908_06390, partial [Myxococcales bacterium]|nr:hypothetical protein [Myxococcales bacterium]
MSLARAAAGAFLGLGALLASGVARADIPPPPNSPDRFCTPEQQCPTGFMKCPYARKPSELGRPPPPGKKAVGDDCRASAAEKGLKYRCRTGGNYSGDQIYCPPGESGSWPGSTALAQAAASASSSATGAGASSTPSAALAASAPTSTAGPAPAAPTPSASAAPAPPASGG